MAQKYTVPSEIQFWESQFHYYISSNIKLLYVSPALVTWFTIAWFILSFNIMENFITLFKKASLQ